MSSLGVQSLILQILFWGLFFIPFCALLSLWVQSSILQIFFGGLWGSILDTADFFFRWVNHFKSIFPIFSNWGRAESESAGRLNKCRELPRGSRCHGFKAWGWQILFPFFFRVSLLRDMWRGMPSCFQKDFSNKAVHDWQVAIVLLLHFLLWALLA